MISNFRVHYSNRCEMIVPNHGVVTMSLPRAYAIHTNRNVASVGVGSCNAIPKHGRFFPFSARFEKCFKARPDSVSVTPFPRVRSMYDG